MRQTNGSGEGNRNIVGNTTVGKREKVLVKCLNEEGEKRRRVDFQCGEALEGRGYVEEEARTFEQRYIYDEGAMV